jgi:hypothetical protein
MHATLAYPKPTAGLPWALSPSALALGNPFPLTNAAPRRPSALVDTRVIYCGDCLGQLRAFPDAYIDGLCPSPPLLAPGFTTQLWASAAPLFPHLGVSAFGISFRYSPSRYGGTLSIYEAMRVKRYVQGLWGRIFQTFPSPSASVEPAHHSRCRGGVSSTHSQSPRRRENSLPPSA